MSFRSRLIYRNAIFRRLWLAQTGSSLGDWFNQVALATVTLNLTHSPTAIGIVLFCRDVPQAVLSFLIGPLLDRYSKRTIMYASDIARAVLCGMFIWGSIQHQMWPFYVGALLMGIASSFFVPARNAVIPFVVAQEDLTEANSLTIATSGLLAITGAAFGGIVTTLLYPSIAFLVNALSFLWSAIWIWMASWKKQPHVERNEQVKLTYLTALKDGLQAVRQNRLVMALLATSVAFALMAGPYFVIIPVLGDLTYHLGGIGIGLLYVADGLAFILSASVLNRVVGKKMDAVYLWYGLGFIIEAVFFVSLSFSTNIWIGMISLFLSQIGAGILMTLASSIMQMIAPPQVRGRIFALDASLDTGTKQLSLLVSGPALSLLGVPLTGLITGGIGCIAAISWWIVSYKVKKTANIDLDDLKR
jgi:MFS family permease